MAQLEGAARTACAACDRHRHSKHGVLEHGHLVEYTHQGTSYTLGLFATLDESHRVCDVLAIKDAVDAGVDLGTLNPHVSLDKYGVDGSTSWAIGWASFPQIVRDLQEYTVRKLPGHELSETVLSSGDAGVSSGGHARDEAQSGQHALPDPSVQRGVRAPPAPAPHSVACGPAYSLASNASMLSGISAAQAMLNLARASDAAEAETRGHAGAVPQRAPAPHAPPPRFDGQPQQPWQQQTHLEVLPANGGVNISAAPTTARKRPHEATGESAAAAPTAAGAHPCSANGGGGAAAARATAAAAAAAVAEMAGRAREAAMLKQPGPSEAGPGANITL
ncbi:hypothetical protein C2E20_2377 [Micractinium conductrix]|uniref:Uncharacterized protein n=1 Tax=Micractinium conductrix TaxID=554055 RepID=A0A2P6VKY7_9CHLO|nr:hypothetical protein C2E20_2377 [Micractinium conductrix]|eukprot:PSC74748.1 hypothetical protein C2E20_2377 [Micractinium conductrix]